MRVLVAGTPDVAVPTLHTLIASGADVASVLTSPDAKGKRGSTLHPSPLKVAAVEANIPVITPEDPNAPEAVEAIRNLEIEVAAVVAYGKMLRPPLLAATTHGWVNLHFSLLPQWRGAAPVQRAIMAGDDVTGASTFLIEEGLDTGPVIGTMTETIRATDTAGDLLDRLAHAGAPLMVESLRALVDGRATPEEQSEEGTSYAAKLSRADAYVDWSRAAHAIDRQIRGCTPAPGAWTTLPDGTVAKLGPVVPAGDGFGGPPGTVRGGDGVEVAAGSGTVRLSWIAPAGKKAMDAQAWWNGARLPEGSQLGEA